MNNPQGTSADSTPTIGFIGLGRMGGPMSRNLLKAGYRLVAFDLNPASLAMSVEAGAVAAQSVADVVQRSQVVMTSLPSSHVFVQVAEESLLPSAQPGQIFIDMGTTEGIETRRLAAAFAERGATLIDAPVSGGGGGSEAGTLRYLHWGRRGCCGAVPGYFFSFR